MKLSSDFEIPEKILYQIRSNCICLRENLGKPKKIMKLSVEERTARKAILKHLIATSESFKKKTKYKEELRRLEHDKRRFSKIGYQIQ